MAVAISLGFGDVGNWSSLRCVEFVVEVDSAQPSTRGIAIKPCFMTTAEVGEYLTGAGRNDDCYECAPCCG